MDERTAAFYNRHADELTRRYESVNGGVSHFFPEVFRPGEEVLDIGAGTGRDCARLLALGVEARGLEPSPDLRDRALAAHPELAGRMLDGSLPGDLGAVAGRTFDGVVLGAVLMHIVEAELTDTARAVSSLLAPVGRLLCSFSTARNDVDPVTSRDAGGRLFLLRPADQVRHLFERAGLHFRQQWETDDALARTGVQWVTQLFVRA